MERVDKSISKKLTWTTLIQNCLLFDNALSCYHLSSGRTDYYNSHNIGKFMHFLIEQDLFADDLPIEEKLGDNCDPHNSI